MIESSGRSLFSAMRPAPVGHNKAFEVPVFLQEVGEQPLVLAGIVTQHAVVGAHDCGGVGILDADFKGQQVTLPRRALVDVDVYGIASALLVVEGVMFDVADNVLGLQALHHRTYHLPGQNGIFAELLLGAATARLAGKGAGSTERHVVTLRAKFATDERSVLIPGLKIPTGGSGHVRRQRRGVAAILPTAADSIR